MQEHLLSIKETAQFFGISESKVRNLKNTGALPFSKIGGSYRISRTDLLNYYNNCKVGQKINSKLKTRAENQPIPINYNRKGMPLYV